MVGPSWTAQCRVHEVAVGGAPQARPRGKGGRLGGLVLWDAPCLTMFW